MLKHSLPLALSFLIASTSLAHYPTKVNIDQAQKKQPSVTFDHAKHGDTLAKSCDTCHHMNKGLKKEHAEKTEVKKCAACHLNPTGAKTPKMSEMGMATNPFHIRCIGCHKTAEKKGPVACNGCHKK